MTAHFLSRPPLPCLVASVLLLGACASLQAQDAVAGKAAFASCAVCHSVDGSQGTGPSLQGVGGRRAGTLAGFAYSRAMKASTTVWNAQTLDAFLADPQGIVPDNLMPHVGMPETAQRADLVFYLMTLPARQLAVRTAIVGRVGIQPPGAWLVRPQASRSRALRAS